MVAVALGLALWWTPSTLAVPLNGGSGLGAFAGVKSGPHIAVTHRGVRVGGRRRDLARPPLARVLIVQRLFHELGYPLGRERSGTFGVRTRGALSYFQRKYGLPVTGYPDVGTVAQMQAVAASLRAVPARGAPRERDLIQKLLGGAPIVGLALGCAFGLALLALAGRRREPLTDR